MDAVQQYDAGRMRGIPRDIQATAKLFVFTGEAEWFFADCVAFKIRQLAGIVRIGKSCEHRSGAQVTVASGDCSGDSDHQSSYRNQFFGMLQSISSTSAPSASFY